MSRAGLFHDRSDLVSVAQGYATAFEEAGADRGKRLSRGRNPRVADPGRTGGCS